MTSPTPKLPTLIRQEIAKRGLTQTEAANQIGVTQQTLSRWANGKLVPSNETVPRLARFLHISQAELKQLRASQTSAGEDVIVDRLDGINSTLKALAREVRRLADARDT